MRLFKEFKVGLSSRNGTYTNSLGFINIQNIDKSWKFKKSYDNWCSINLVKKEVNLINELTEGFVINEGIGGHSRHYNDGREPKVRVYDPRGFEIEITMDNFFEIIKYGLHAGKGLVGKYAYTFNGDSLTLLNEVEYNKLVNDTPEEKPKKLNDKEHELVVGYRYYKNDLDKEGLVYLGKLKLPLLQIDGSIKESTKQTFALDSGDKYFIGKAETKAKFKYYSEEKFKSENDIILVDGRILIGDIDKESKIHPYDKTMSALSEYEGIRKLNKSESVETYGKYMYIFFDKYSEKKEKYFTKDISYHVSDYWERKYKGYGYDISINYIIEYKSKLYIIKQLLSSDNGLNDGIGKELRSKNTTPTKIIEILEENGLYLKNISVTEILTAKCNEFLEITGYKELTDELLIKELSKNTNIQLQPRRYRVYNKISV